MKVNYDKMYITQIENEHRKGLSYRALAKKYGICKTTLLRYIQRLKHPVYKKQQSRKVFSKYPQPLIVELLREYFSGTSVKNLSTKYNIPSNTIYFKIKKEKDKRFYNIVLNYPGITSSLAEMSKVELKEMKRSILNDFKTY